MADPAELTHSDTEVASIIEAFDGMVATIEAHLRELEAELPAAMASGDDRYVRRVERGMSWSRDLLGILETSVLDCIMDLRTTARQLGLARQGKMV